MSSEMASRTQGSRRSETGRLDCGSTVEREDLQTIMEDVSSSISRYCGQRPKTAGLLIFALGFYVGWKIKPW